MFKLIERKTNKQLSTKVSSTSSVRTSSSTRRRKDAASVSSSAVSTSTKKKSSGSSRSSSGLNLSRASTVFTRLGGVPAVRAAVSIFYERLLADERLRFFFDDTNMHSLKMHQFKFLKLALNDEIPVDLDVAAYLIQKHLILFKTKGLNETHFDMVAVHLIETLQGLGVPQDLVDETVAIVGPLRDIFVIGAKVHGGNAPSGSTLPTSSEGHDSFTTQTSFEDHPHSEDQQPQQQQLVVDTLPSSPSIDKKMPESGERRSGEEDAVTAAMSETSSTLLLRMGGPEPLKVAIQDLYDRLLSDDALAPFFQGVDMEILKRHQHTFMQMVLSDQVPDFVSVDSYVRRAHQRVFRKYGMDERDFDRFLIHFSSMLQKFFDDIQLIDDVENLIAPLRTAFEDGLFRVETLEL